MSRSRTSQWVIFSHPFSPTLSEWGNRTVEGQLSFRQSETSFLQQYGKGPRRILGCLFTDVIGLLKKTIPEFPEPKGKVPLERKGFQSRREKMLGTILVIHKTCAWLVSLSYIPSINPADSIAHRKWKYICEVLINLLKLLFRILDIMGKNDRGIKIQSTQQLHNFYKRLSTNSFKPLYFWKN